MTASATRVAAPAPARASSPSRAAEGLQRITTRSVDGQPREACEHEADRIAEATVNPRSPFAGNSLAAIPVLLREPDTDARSAAARSRKGRAVDATPLGVPSIVGDVLRGQGRPLDPSARAFMEPRFGHDFSHVRIHADAAADRSAAAVDALAYTVGRHIVFGRGRYAPGESAGRRLLAHELTHVLQQSGPTAPGPTLQRQGAGTPSTPTKFYQEVVDTLAGLRSQMAAPGGRTTPTNLASLKALLALCQAVDENRVDDISKLLDALLLEGLSVHLQTISEKLMIELAARMNQLGLETHGQRLRQAYAKESLFSPGLPYDFHASSRNVDFFSRLVELALSASSTETTGQIESSFNLMVRALVPLRDALAAVDPQAVAREQGLGPTMHGPGMSHGEYYRALVDQVERLTGGLQALLQTVIDGIRADFEAGRAAGSEKLNLLQRLMEGQLRPVLFPDVPEKSIADLRLAITHTSIKKGKGEIADAFPRGRGGKKRSVAVTTYDPDQDYAQELQMSLGNLYRVRMDQIAVLGRIYGDTTLLRRTSKNFDSAMDDIDDAERNKEAIAKLKDGRLRLDSDDDWREFVLQKYRDMTNPTGKQHLLKRSPAEALHAVIDTLFQYLQAFTVHSHYTNIYDIGDPYLNKDFPRTLSGQLVHDCGVYAVRVAYILSLVRQDLKLRFRFVFMPAHVALLVEGDNLPTYIFQNDHYEEIKLADLEKVSKNFKNFTEPKTISETEGGVTVTTEVPVKPGPTDDTQFSGELVAGGYINAPADMPFKSVEIPAGTDARSTQRKLWETYEANATKGVLGPAAGDKKDPDYLFQQRYLALTESMRRLYNEAILPFWNVQAPAIWNAFRIGLTQSSQAADIPAETLAGWLKLYLAAYDAALAPVLARRDDVNRQAQAISAELRNNPKLQQTAVKLSSGARAASLRNYAWEGYRTATLQQYSDGIDKLPKGTTVKIDDIFPRITPPFIPSDEKAMSPLD